MVDYDASRQKENRLRHNFVAVINGGSYDPAETNDKSLKKMYGAIRDWHGGIFYIFLADGTRETAQDIISELLKRYTVKGKFKTFTDCITKDESLDDEVFSEAIFLVPREELDDMMFLAKLMV